MKTKTLFIVLIILILAFIGWTVLQESKTLAPTLEPETSDTTSNTTVAHKSASTSSKPATSDTVRLAGGQHVSTTQLTVGQKLIITVTDPIDAGYTINDPQYDTKVLGLTSHTHNASAGINGTDTYEFTAIKVGTTGIAINAIQGINKSSAVILFSGAISVK